MERRNERSAWTTLFGRVRRAREGETHSRVVSESVVVDMSILDLSRPGEKSSRDIGVREDGLSEEVFGIWRRRGGDRRRKGTTRSAFLPSNHLSLRAAFFEPSSTLQAPNN